MTDKRICALVASMLLSAAVGCGDELESSAPSGGGAPSLVCADPEVSLRGDCLFAGIVPERCGAGFISDGRAGCEAVLPSERCPPGTMALPGETTCRQVEPCAEGTWGDLPLDASTQHVDAAYAAGDADGSAARPWPTVQEAVDAASDGGLVAVAAGLYEEDVVLAGKRTVLWGRCPDLVTIAGVGDEISTVTVGVGADGSEIRGVAVTGSGIGVGIVTGDDIVVDRVWIRKTGRRGLDAERAGPGTRVLLVGSLVEETGEPAVYVSGAEVSIADSVVRGGRGPDIEAVYRDTKQARATLSIARSVVEDAEHVGVLLVGSSASIEESVVRDIAPAPVSDVEGPALIAQPDPSGERSSLVVTTSVLERSRSSGVFVAASDAVIEETVVRDTLAGAGGVDGRGIVLQHDEATGSRATLTLRSCVVERSRSTALFVGSSDAVVESSVLRDSLPQESDGAFGRGLGVQRGPGGGRAAVSFTSSIIEASYGFGMLVHDSDVTVAGTLIRATAARLSDGSYGDGIALLDGAAVSVRASAIEASDRAGIGNFGSMVSLADTVLDCNPIPLDGEPSDGVPFTFDDLGGNACGCPPVPRACSVQTTALEPPGAAELAP